MRKRLPSLTILLGTLLLAQATPAQQTDRFAYAVTDVQPGANWSFLRKLNLNTGEYSQVLMSGDNINFVAYDATSRKQFETPLTDKTYGQLANAPFGTGVAAMAFDKKNNRIYYTPMFIDQLRYIDIKTMKAYYVTDQAFTGKPNKSSDQGNIVTRMVIAADGNGYAMTNDATQLIRFTTGKKLAITDLGAIADDQANKGVSIHNSCSSYGGDIVADDEGNLYVFSARNHVFRVNIETKVATHLGTISGLPSNFTVNGAVVNENNQVVVASAMESNSYFSVDMKTLAATPYKLTGTVWHTSDLGNSNMLVSGNKAKGGTVDLISRQTPGNNDNTISIFPNPVTNNQFMMQFSQLAPGDYTIRITDVMGREIMQQPVTISNDNQTQLIRLSSANARGVYLVKVTGAAGKAVYSSKLVLQ